MVPKLSPGVIVGLVIGIVIGLFLQASVLHPWAQALKSPPLPHMVTQPLAPPPPYMCQFSPRDSHEPFEDGPDEMPAMVLICWPIYPGPPDQCLEDTI